MEKVPKRYECTECGFISNKTKSLKFPTMTFAICFKCRGKLKESDKWLEWHHRMVERTRPAFQHSS